VKVGTGSTDVLLDRLQPSGKQMMLAADWARGLRADRVEFV
jgi:methionyl-tRNA formyltransferase